VEQREDLQLEAGKGGVNADQIIGRMHLLLGGLVAEDGGDIGRRRMLSKMHASRARAVCVVRGEKFGRFALFSVYDIGVPGRGERERGG